ncbi:hypothetical protein SBA5_810021 [Candidatus Sulfotelmatomonas gaucii]|uniref:Uncharacterized protein n=1 Tax=Candidatus Sulfuritelmatomonas gaucii TaxID=2043161 RepID=A0A2N9M658_9BACT|nr:hypothetical protein SBA5_810021 [Candidatus Sulfotelmatomonas gaucii]
MHCHLFHTLVILTGAERSEGSAVAFRAAGQPNFNYFRIADKPSGTRISRVKFPQHRNPA